MRKTAALFPLHLISQKFHRSHVSKHGKTERRKLWRLPAKGKKLDWGRAEKGEECICQEMLQFCSSTLYVYVLKAIIEGIEICL
jgi:hypothetical protein